jgi:hypothetical protein
VDLTLFGILVFKTFEGIDPLSLRGLGWHHVTLGRGERCCLWTLIITRIYVASG